MRNVLPAGGVARSIPAMGRFRKKALTGVGSRPTSHERVAPDRKGVGNKQPTTIVRRGKRGLW